MSSARAHSLRVGLLAGESSGDILGAGLMQAVRNAIPDVEFSGIGGPLMQAQGLVSRAPMERLAVMGLIEPLKRLPELLGIRKDIIRFFKDSRPDVFIGIDSPDFNLTVEQQLRSAGIRTVHYVSPSVWAWRQGRIRKIARAVDLVLTLLPFEAAFYQQHQVPVVFVGHPLADTIPMEPDVPAARAALDIDPAATVLALLPGSRHGEVARLGPVFLQAAALIARERKARGLEVPLVLLPCANAERWAQLQAMPGCEAVRLLDGQSRLAMTAADAVILASGTAALEAMLLKKPMLVCYRMAPLSYAIISRMMKVRWFSLPNLLSGEALVEELVQDQVNTQSLALKATQLLETRAGEDDLQQRYRAIHQQLAGGASEKAAAAVLALL